MTTYTPMTISATPRRLTAPGTSCSVRAAMTAPNRGAAARRGLVRVAPIRFWLAFSSVHPRKKCTIPASANSPMAPGGACRSRLKSSVASEATVRITALTDSWMKVDS